MKKNYKIKEGNKTKLKRYIALNNKLKKRNETNARQPKCSTRK
jgi:hypothetical protein